MSCRHELCERRVPEDVVVREVEFGYVENDAFRSVVVSGAEGDHQGHLPERHRDPGVTPLNGFIGRPQGHLHLFEDIEGKDVEARASVHQHVGQLDVANCRGDHQGSLGGLRG